MNRRGFLGSLLGTVAAVDFFVRLEQEEYQRVVLPYRMLFKDSISGYVIQAPGVAEIVHNPVAKMWSFIAEELCFDQPVILDRAILLTEDGQVIRESKFQQRIHMFKDYKLKLTQSIITTVDVPTAEELVGRMISGNYYECERLRASYHSGKGSD